MKKNIIISLAILSNLLIGCGYFMLASDDTNYLLMIALSISCIIFNYNLFSKMAKQDRGRIVQLAFSILTSFIIVLIGITVTCIFNFNMAGESLLMAIFLNIGVAIMMIIGGFLVSYPAIIGFGVLNYVWIRILKFATRPK